MYASLSKMSLTDMFIRLSEYLSFVGHNGRHIMTNYKINLSSNTKLSGEHVIFLRESRLFFSLS